MVVNVGVVQEGIVFWIMVGGNEVEMFVIEFFIGFYIFDEEYYVFYFDGCSVFVDGVVLVDVVFFVLGVYMGVLQLYFVFD